MAIPIRHAGTREQALRRQRRLLTFGGVILAAQVINTAMIWVSRGRFPILAAVAMVGVWIFWVLLLRQYRRVLALPPTPVEKPGRKRKKLRDPHRGPPGRRE